MSSLWVRRAAVAGLAVLAFGTAARACETDETYLFACQTKDEGRSLFLCGTEADDGQGMHWTGVRFLYRTEKGDEISYPADPSQGPKLLFFSHLFNKGAYQAQVRFADGARSYRLFFHDASEATSAGAARAAEGGLDIYDGGKLTSTIQCGEAPSWYFDETRKLLACDLDNPYGVQGCSDQVPDVK